NPKAEFKTFDVDCVKQITTPSKTFEKPYIYNFSFGQTYGHDGLARFGADMAEGYLGGYLEKIKNSGGLYAFLTGPEVGLDKILDDALKGGLKLGSAEIFTAQNLMSFIKDLSEQIDDKFLADPQIIYDLIYQVADKAVKLQVSDYPCTKFIDLLGFGDPDRPGNLEEAAYSVLAYAYRGDEDITDDVFLNDAIDFYKNRDGGEKTFKLLKDILINDLVEGAILSSLDFHPATVFPPESILAVLGLIIDALMNTFFPTDQSFYNIIYSFLNLAPKPYNSLEGIVDAVLGEYLTDSQYEAWGYTIAEIIEGFVVDNDPGFKMDANVTIENISPAPVIASVDNYRLPSHISVTFGDDSTADRNISWMTKYSVTASDIELIPFSENPVFTGNPTKDANIKTGSEKVTRSYPGADLGIWGFIDFNFNMIRHTVKITGLAPGSKYLYRVGDAAKGWWSEVGVIETADNSDAFTFFHMTDPQSQNVRQYNVWAQTLDKALDLFPQGKFIVSSGDLVDNRHNFNQWKHLFNTASKNLMSKPLMTTAGNHEESGGVLDENFLLPSAPDQNRDSGVYYSFDYNNAHFIILNTNSLSSKKALDDAQIEWLKKDAAASNAKWKILSLHKAIYSNGSHYNDSDVSAIRKQLASLLPEIGIDLVLQGHDHVYLRTDAMSGNKVIKSESKTVSYKGRDYKAKQDPKGSVYAIGACAGVKIYTPKNAWTTDLYFPRAEKIVTAENPVFSAIQIDGDRLYFDAFEVGGDTGKRIDSFAIEKTVLQTNENMGENKDNSQALPTVPSGEQATQNENSLDSIPQTGYVGNEVAFLFVLFTVSAFIAYWARKKKRQVQN
ncbi:MAG TPA: metallophosphoesterase family protein, partial [Clostridiales bacterium]|nr:metallophosphoesterase family protein [Clostridiales bacterium]